MEMKNRLVREVKRRRGKDTEKEERERGMSEVVKRGDGEREREIGN